MLLWMRRRLVSIGLCALLSLVLSPAAALPCPGEGPETLSVNPRSAVFESRAAARNFIFSWEGPGGGIGTTELRPTENFRITSDGCTGFSFSNTRGCNVQVEMIREGGSARLTVSAGGRQETAELIGAVAGPLSFRVEPETSQRFERVGDIRRFTLTYSEGPVGMRLRRGLVPLGYFVFQEDTCIGIERTMNLGYSCTFVVRKERAGETVDLAVELWNARTLGIKHISLIG